MGSIRLLKTDDAIAVLKRLIFPVCLGTPLAFMLWRAVQVFDFRALTLFLICGAFLCISLIFRRFERAVLGLVFILVPINVDINFEIGPTLYSMGLPQGTSLLNLSVIDLAILILYPMWIVRLLTNRYTERIYWPAGGVPFLLFTAWGALSMLNAPNPLLAGLEVVCFLKTFLCFFYLANNIKTKDDLWYAAKCLLAGMFFQSLIGCAQQSLQRNIGLYVLGERKEEKMMNVVQGGPPVFRIGGTLGHPTFLGGYLAVLLPVALAAAIQPMRASRRILACTVFTLGALVLIFSYCRSAWLVTAMTLPLILLRWYRIHLRNHKFTAAPLILICLLGTCLLAPLVPTIHTRMTQDDKGSTESRLPQWMMGWNMIKAHPFLGVGLNNYNVVSDFYEPNVVDPNIRTRVFVFNSKIHNVYLGVAAQTGWVGLFLYLWFLRNVLWHGWKKMKIAQEESVRSLLAGMILGLAAMLAHEAVHTGNISGNMILWVVAACLSGPLIREEHDQK